MLASVILSGSEESDTLILFFQIFHFVQDDMMGLLSQILHSACGSVQDDMVSRHVRMQPLSYALGGISSAHISTFSLTSAQANHVTRSDGHSLCACLTFSTDICAADPRSTAYIQYSLRMSRPFPRHVRQQSPLYSVYHDFHAHISLVAMRCG